MTRVHDQLRSYRRGWIRGEHRIWKGDPMPYGAPTSPPPRIRLEKGDNRPGTISRLPERVRTDMLVVSVPRSLVPEVGIGIVAEGPSLHLKHESAELRMDD